MTDDRTFKGSADRKRINTSEDHEVRYWSEKFGVSTDQLKAAVQKVGPWPTMLHVVLEKVA